MKKEHEEKALAIFRQLKGMSIAEAQELLRWCGDYLLNQPVRDVIRKPEVQKECAL